MKDGFVLRQENGLYCMISNDMQRIIGYNLTDKELIYDQIERTVAELRTDIRKASVFDNKYAELIINAAQEGSERVKVENTIKSMKETLTKYLGEAGSFVVRMKFKTDYLKSDFMEQLNHSVITKERLNKSNWLRINSETPNSIEILINGTSDYRPLISCRYDSKKATHKYTDTTERNEYLFNIICASTKTADEVARLVRGQLESTNDFSTGKISIDVIDKMVIVLFDIDSDYYPIFTLI